MAGQRDYKAEYARRVSGTRVGSAERAIRRGHGIRSSPITGLTPRQAAARTRFVSRETFPPPERQQFARPRGRASAVRQPLGPLGRELVVRGERYPAAEAIHRAWLDAGSPAMLRVVYHGLVYYKRGNAEWTGPKYQTAFTRWVDVKASTEGAGVDSWLDALFGNTGAIHPGRPRNWFGWVEIERS